jgi:cytochrome c553
VALNPEYLKRQLENYAGGKRGGKVEDYYGQKMHLASTRLTPRDITDLVRYIGELARGDDPRVVMEK